ncbi:hypothetical protein K5O24_001954 [Salmonella enterica subsp. enterica serovar Durham]|nr:hypothetical protein [Salmonella enterica subsp. enterica serovar Durham]EHW9737346.1 hypothetical protein [Salmonella enterica subsp. enterica serovar Durham]EHX4336095.1 hypothetical protein [Salmonella enterica subsp. enterica serovar Durham]EHZ3128736.1 hypothetical protein [Salmonella enterica subsp. enterica serovar Durham]
MNTEITIKNAQLIRSGYHTRGFVSANTLFSIPINIASKNAIVKYQGARIGRIDNLYYSDLRNDRVELRCNIIFTGDFTLLEDMVRDKALYPVCVINIQENEAWLSEIFFAPAEDREFDEQEPINLSPLLNLVNNIAKSEAPAEPQDDTPYICAPGMSREETIRWLMDVLAALGTNKEDYVSQMTDIENRKQFIHSEFNNKLEILRKAFPQLDPESILSQDRKVTLI